MLRKIRDLQRVYGAAESRKWLRCWKTTMFGDLSVTLQTVNNRQQWERGLQDRHRDVKRPRLRFVSETVVVCDKNAVSVVAVCRAVLYRGHASRHRGPHEPHHRKTAVNEGFFSFIALGEKAEEFFFCQPFETDREDQTIHTVFITNYICIWIKSISSSK